MYLLRLIPWLALGHGIYNSTVILLFFVQGWMGWTIRKARGSGAPIPFAIVRRHRRLGPVIAGLGIAGFLFGATVVTMDKGRPLEYPLHFSIGLLIVLMILLLAYLSTRIKGQDARFRGLHARLGILLLAVYFLQAFIGLGVLL